MTSEQPSLGKVAYLGPLEGFRYRAAFTADSRVRVVGPEWESQGAQPSFISEKQIVMGDSFVGGERSSRELRKIEADNSRRGGWPNGALVGDHR